VLLALLEGAGWRELMFLHCCQPIRLGSDKSRGAWKTKTKTGFKAFSCFLLLSVSLFLASTGELAKNHLKRKRKKQQQPQQLQCRSVATPRAVATPQRFSTASCCSARSVVVPQRRSIASCCSVAAP